MNYDEARKLGVKALFEEKYGNVVRVLEIPGFSSELCGGTHVGNTGEIGFVKIAKDEGIGSGVRRLVAYAGEASFSLALDAFSALRSLSDLLGVSGGDARSLEAKARELLAEKKQLERKNQELLLRGASEGVSDLLKSAVTIGDAVLVTGRFDDTPRDLLRQIGDRIKQSEPRAVMLLAGVEGDAVTLVGMAADAAVKSGVHAGNLVKEAAALIGGSGGGKPATGQGGGKDPSKLEEALAAARRIVTAQLEKGK
jgi:alanyl-tRNA synthetase